MNPHEHADPDATIYPEEPENPDTLSWKTIERKIERVKGEIRGEVQRLQDVSAERYRILDGNIAELKGVVARIESVTNRTAVRVQRSLDTHDVSDTEIAKLRKEFRDSQTAMRAPYDDMTATTKTRALTQKDADLMLANQELERLRREVENGDKDREARQERTRHYTRAIFAGVVSLAVVVAGAWVVSKALTPQVSSTTIQTQGASAK